MIVLSSSNMGLFDVRSEAFQPTPIDKKTTEPFILLCILYGHYQHSLSYQER